MFLTNIKPIYFVSSKLQNKAQPFSNTKDSIQIENPNINKKVLIERGLLGQNQNINAFFDKVSTDIFQDSINSHAFSQALKLGYISLSSSCYSDLKNPQSAIALKLNPKNSPIKRIAQLEEHIDLGRGIGLNFSEFENPISEIKNINSYFKFRQSSCKRPPAGIALLNINHPKILDFISLKDNEDYRNWCFDLSVVIPDDFMQKVDNDLDVELSNGSKLKARTIYFKLLDSMKKKGEPGIIFSNDKDYICDCCAATKLKQNEGLVLGQINLSRFVNPKTNTVDYDFMQNCSLLLSQAMKKIDKNSYIGILGYKTMLDKMQIKYASSEANNILEKSMSVISDVVHSNDLKVALSPTGTISRMLNVTPSIEPVFNQGISYFDEIDTMALVQKYCDGNISKTINLKQNHSIEDIDSIIRYSKDKGIKGISVFPC